MGGTGREVRTEDDWSLNQSERCDKDGGLAACVCVRKSGRLRMSMFEQGCWTEAETEGFKTSWNGRVLVFRVWF